MMRLDLEKKALPAWLDERSQTILGFPELPPNWNTYGARPVDRAVALAAARLLQDVVSPDSPCAEVIPTTTGGVQIEWHVHGIDLEVRITCPDYYAVSFELLGSGESWERAFDYKDRDRLRAAIARLTQNS